ncbi:MAG: hypothetical protein ACRD6X_17415 [Pyrinomonadaceae bacterium]
MKNKADAQNAVIGVGWYRAEQWQRLLEISEDRNNLEETHEAWFAVAEKTIKTAELSPRARKVDIDVEDLLSWCNARGFDVNSTARAQYVADKLRKEDHARNKETDS